MKKMKQLEEENAKLKKSPQQELDMGIGGFMSFCFVKDGRLTISVYTDYIKKKDLIYATKPNKSD